MGEFARSGREELRRVRRTGVLDDPSVGHAKERELGDIDVLPGRRSTEERARVGAARTQLHGDAVFFYEELDPAPLPVGKRLKEIGEVRDPRVRAAGKVRSPHSWVEELAYRFEIMSVAGLEVVGEDRKSVV